MILNVWDSSFTENPQKYTKKCPIMTKNPEILPKNGQKKVLIICKKEACENLQCSKMIKFKNHESLRVFLPENPRLLSKNVQK